MSAPLKVWSLLYYLTEVGVTWRQEDWTANRIIKAVKGEPFNGYFKIKIGGKWTTFEQSNVEQFMPTLFRAVANKIGDLVKGEFALVPIPNSSATINDGADFRTFEHARAIAAIIGGRATAVPALRWNEAKIPAHEGGTRDPQAHFDNLRVVQKLTRPVVLFDDVLTTGGQMIASYRRLAKSGAAPVLGAVIGRATKEQKESALGWHGEDLETEDMPFDLNEFLNQKF